MSQQLTQELTTEQSTDESPADVATPEGIVSPEQSPAGEISEDQSEQSTEG
jgi:hypothetical protein